MNSVRFLRIRPAAVLALAGAIWIAVAPVPGVGPGLAHSAPVAYEIDPNHSRVGFRIRHLVSKVTGQFDKLSGTIVYDAENPAASSVEVAIDPASIDTNQSKRDDHLRSPDFFDVATFPQMSFKSRAAKADGTKLVIEGDLTMHGVTKPVTLTGEATGVMQEPGGNQRAGFAATTKLNRKDFGIEWNKTFDEGGTLLGDDVDVEITIEAVYKAPAAEEKK